MFVATKNSLIHRDKTLLPPLDPSRLYFPSTDFIRRI